MKLTNQPKTLQILTSRDHDLIVNLKASHVLSDQSKEMQLRNLATCTISVANEN